MRENVHEATVRGFGEEWSRFDQSRLSSDELRRHFDAYFRIFPWESLPEKACGFDAGCGSGRWAKLVAPRVHKLHCVDASDAALAVARRNLGDAPNVEFHHSSVASMPFADGSMDFGYSLGVLHHLPDTAAALGACTAKLKRGAPFLVYLYYRFDDRPAWFRAMWGLSDAARRGISRLPSAAKTKVTDAIAAGVYLPLARFSKAAERLGLSVNNVPLSGYRHASFYTMRTDALDRFGTQLEQRFTAPEVRELMSAAGLGDVVLSDQPPFWCAVGRRT